MTGDRQGSFETKRLVKRPERVVDRVYPPYRIQEGENEDVRGPRIRRSRSRRDTETSPATPVQNTTSPGDPQPDPVVFFTYAPSSDTTGQVSDNAVDPSGADCEAGVVVRAATGTSMPPPMAAPPGSVMIARRCSQRRQATARPATISSCTSDPSTASCGSWSMRPAPTARARSELLSPPPPTSRSISRRRGRAAGRSRPMITAQYGIWNNQRPARRPDFSPGPRGWRQCRVHLQQPS